LTSHPKTRVEFILRTLLYATDGSFIHSFIHSRISIAPHQVPYYLEALEDAMMLILMMAHGGGDEHRGYFW